MHALTYIIPPGQSQVPASFRLDTYDFCSSVQLILHRSSVLSRMDCAESTFGELTRQDNVRRLAV